MVQTRRGRGDVEGTMADQWRYGSGLYDHYASPESLGDWQELEVFPMATIGFSQALEELSERDYHILIDLPRACSWICALFVLVYIRYIIYKLCDVESEINYPSLNYGGYWSCLSIRRHIVTSITESLLILKGLSISESVQ